VSFLHFGSATAVCPVAHRAIVRALVQVARPSGLPLAQQNEPAHLRRPVAHATLCCPPSPPGHNLGVGRV
jgi:hypothetical protein